jgi:hypothetical protein
MSQETAILAGGCFWGVQDLLRRYPGVISSRVGYTGGDVPNAPYRNHGNPCRSDRNSLRSSQAELSKDSRTVAGADVIALTIASGRVVNLKEKLKNL